MSATALTIPARRLLLRCPAAPRISTVPVLRATAQLHTSSSKPATPLPITAHGPPPQAPAQPASLLSEWRTRHKLAQASIKNKKRFWKDSHVVPVQNGYHIQLDKRVIKTPEKRPVEIPSTKPLLALALANEWASLRSSKDAVKPHLVPLTQLSSRVLDVACQPTMRSGIVNNLLPYLDTDTVLCIAPTTPQHLREPGQKTLREIQEESAKKIVNVLTSTMWKDVELKMLDGDLGFFGTGGQSPETKEYMRQWALNLDDWQLIGFERIVLAAKSFVVGARMVQEWGMPGGEKKWGVEEAAQAAEIEVRYQTTQWGEVEDSHDVEKEDTRRQIGAGWLLIASQEA